MSNNKLIGLLSTLSRKEMTRFREFCFSPYFNKHDQVRALVGYLSDIYPVFDQKRCERQLLFKKVFGKGTFDSSKLALVFTYTQRCLEKFFAQEQYEENDFSKKLLLLNGLKAKSQYTTFEKALKKIEKERHRATVRDASYYFDAYQIAKQADDYYNLLDRRRVDNSLANKQENLDHFFILEKLRDACEARIRQNFLKVDYQTRFLDQVLAEIQEYPETYQDHHAILVFYKVYLMLDGGMDLKLYRNALEYLNHHTNVFSREDLIGIYIYFMNYCIAGINQGHSEFLKEIFMLYKAQLEQGLLLENDELSEWDYKNIVTTAIRLGELDWVIGFIEDYKAHLNEDAKENAYRFNLASYYYASGEYDKVLHLLIRVEYSDLRYNLGAKALLMRTYYDLQEYEALNSLTESFRQYLLRNKLMADNRRKGFYNLFKLARKIANLRAKSSFISKEKTEKEINKLREEVTETHPMVNQSWLLEKLNDLN